MKDENLISDSLYQDLKNVDDGIYPDRVIKKELYLVQDGPLDGNTVDSSFAEYPTPANPNREKLKIEAIKVLKVGGSKYLRNQLNQNQNQEATP